ncbi:MAG TPA: Ig-like domain repeat protein [Candidatus Sulfotelmatobacter sp.]|nr:Ig-like domain repeat protein [Candidatus Sulfotelmatobacter sp.]
MKPYRSARGLFFAQLLLLAALMPAHADNTNGTGWKGTLNVNWSTPGNWDSDAPTNSPGSSDRNLFFGQGYATAGGTGSTTANNDLTGWHGFRVTFQDIGSDASGANDKSFTITGNSFTTYDFGGNFPRIENDSYVTQTFNLTSGQTLGVDGNNGGQFGEINPVNGDIIISAGTKVDLGDITQLRIYGNNGHNLTFNGPISSSGNTNLNSVAINQNSTVIFAATNTYGGDTFVNAGTLRCATNNAITNSTFVRLGDVSGTVGANLNLDGGLNLAAKFNVRAGSSGTKIIANTSTTTGNATFTGNFFLDDNVTLFANTGGGNTLSGSTLDLKNQTLTVSGTGSNVISGTLTNSTGSGKLAISATGPTTLSGINYYAGGTTLNSGALLYINSSTALGIGTLTVSAGATNDNTSASAITLANNNPLTLSGGSLTFLGTHDLNIGTGTVTISGATRTVTVNAGTLTFGGGVTDAGGARQLTKAGAGTLALNGAAGTWTGGLSVNAGTLIAGSDTAAGTGNLTLLGGTFQPGGTRTFANNILLAASSTITAANNLTLNGSLISSNASRTLTINNTGNTTFNGNIYLSDDNTTASRTMTVNGSGNVTFNGPIANNNVGNTVAVKLTINGTGVVTLAGTNAYTGTTTISNGTLLVNGVGAASALTNSTGILGGTGVIIGVTAILTNSILQPGLGGDTATLTISNTLSLAGKAIFGLNRTNTQNASKISGLTSVAYGGTLLVTNLGPALQAGDTFPLFSSAAYSGGFTNIVLPALTGALVWNTNNLAVNGSIAVALSPVTLGLTSSENPAGFQDSLAFTANVTPTAATGNVVFMTNGVPFSTSSLITGTATSTALNSLPRGTNTITAIYSGDSNYFGNTNSLSQIVTNHPPVANNAGYSRSVSTSWKIKLTDLVTNATDVDGDTLTVTAFGTSTNGVTLTTGSGYAFYMNTNVVNDQFTYTVSDGFGGSATATISLTAQAFATGQSGSVSVSGSSATVSFAGIPGLSYTIQRSTNLVSWTGILTTNAPSGGVFNVIDNFTDLGGPPGSAYYRLQYNP